MVHFARKPVFDVLNLVVPKSACLATDTSKNSSMYMYDIFKLTIDKVADHTARK